MTEISSLRRGMIEDMTVRNLSPATQRSWVQAVAKLGRFFGRSSERLGLEEVRFLEAGSSRKARAALTTAYAAGLGASEAARWPISTAA
jgi:hypothetical protein